MIVLIGELIHIIKATLQLKMVIRKLKNCKLFCPIASHKRFNRLDVEVSSSTNCSTEQTAANMCLGVDRPFVIHFSSIWPWTNLTFSMNFSSSLIRHECFAYKQPPITIDKQSIGPDGKLESQVLIGCRSWCHDVVFVVDLGIITTTKWIDGNYSMLFTQSNIWMFPSLFEKPPKFTSLLMYSTK